MGEPETAALQFLDRWYSRLSRAADKEGNGFTPAVFPVQGDDVEVLESPTQFYNTLCDEIRQSQQRVSLAALYIGDGALEQQLLSTLRDTLHRHSHPDTSAQGQKTFRLNILVDYARAIRGIRSDIADNSHSSSSPPQQCVDELGQASRIWWEIFGNNPSVLATNRPGNATQGRSSARISLFRHPKFDESRVLDKVPGVLRETVAVQHIKAYVIDNTVIVSGANLSNDYFSDRQDRYIVFRNAPQLAEFFDGLICNVLAPHSHEIDPVSAAIRQPEQELKSLGNALLDWQRTWAAKKPASEVLDPTKSIQSDRLDTWVVPSIQLYCAGLDDDHRWTLAFLDAVIEHVWSPRLSIATGYFNCPPDYCDRLLRLGLPRASTESEDLPSKSSGFFQVITAAPRANGFFGARGVMGLVPVMYNEYLQDFLKRMQSSRSRGEICEFERPGWTFHAKGIWVEGKMYDNHDCHTVADVADCAEVSCEQISGPFLSVVGSSNFGFRSVERDLEAQLFVGTSNINLRATLATERNALLSQCVRQVDLPRVMRHAGQSIGSHSNAWWLRPVSWALRRFF